MRRSAMMAKRVNGRTISLTNHPRRRPCSLNRTKRKALSAAIDVLNDRERRIFEARHLVDEPLTLEDLAANFNVSRERIRQIEARAFEKVRKAARNLAVRAPA